MENTNVEQDTEQDIDTIFADVNRDIKAIFDDINKTSNQIIAILENMLAQLKLTEQLQKECEMWLDSPKTRDGKLGILLRCGIKNSHQR